MCLIDLHNIEGLEYLKTLDDGSIQLFLLDLPYGCTDNNWDIKLNLDEMWRLIKIKLKPGGLVVCFGTAKFCNELYNSNKSWFKYDLIWVKSSAQGFLLSNKAPLRKHELIYVFGNSSGDDYCREYNKVNREYAKQYKEELQKQKITLTTIEKFIGNYGFSHFMGYNAQQFGLPTENNYNKVSIKYNIINKPFYLSYEELKKRSQTQALNVYNHGVILGDLINTKRGKRCTNYGDVIDKKYIKTGRYPNSILEYKHDNEHYHPTQKPIKLLEKLVCMYSNINDVVCDFTMGSGSVAIACLNTNRHFKGCELDKDIFKIAVDRVEEHKNNIL